MKVKVGIVVFDDMLDYNRKAIDAFLTTARLKDLDVFCSSAIFV